MGQVTQSIRNAGLFLFGMALIVVGYKVNEAAAQAKIEKAELEAANVESEKLKAQRAQETALMDGMEAGKKKTEKEKSKVREKDKQKAKAKKKKSKLEKDKPEKAHASK